MEVVLGHLEATLAALRAQQQRHARAEQALIEQCLTDLREVLLASGPASDGKGDSASKKRRREEPEQLEGRDEQQNHGGRGK